MEITIRCMACGCMISQGGIAEGVQLKAPDVMGYAKHHAGCTINDPKRSAPRVTVQNTAAQTDQGPVQVTTYAIYAGNFVDAEMEVL